MGKNESIEIDLKEILFMILRKWYIVLFFLALLSITSYIYSKYYIKPVYRAETTLFLGKEQDKLGPLSVQDIDRGSQLLEDYTEILYSKKASRMVEEKIGQDLNYYAYKASLGVQTIKGARIFRIIYNSPDPELATLIVNKTAEVMIQLADEIVDVKNVQVLDVAERPYVPIEPNIRKNVTMAGFVGLVIGIFIVLFIEFLDNTFKKPEDIENKLGFNVIGTIPKFDDGQWNLKKGIQDGKNRGGVFENLKVFTHPNSITSEAYRELRTNIKYTSIDKKVKIISVVSSDQGEGKTSTAANLAIAIAQSKKKVLLIDADLRKPRVHKYFRLNNDCGLTNILTEVDDVKRITGVNEFMRIPNLYIITSGAIPPNPSELFETQKMNRLLTYFKNNFDMIIIDTPPVGGVTDAAIISTKVDGVLFVIASGHTNAELVKRSKKALEGINSNILGVVMTKVNKSTGMYYNYKKDGY